MNHPAFGEQSPEIGVITEVKKEEEVGITDKPQNIKINDKKLDLKEDGSILYLEHELDEAKEVKIEVEGNPDTNIYINKNYYKAKGNHIFKKKDLKEDYIRIIVQEGIKEPRIYTLKIKGLMDSNDSEE